MKLVTSKEWQTSIFSKFHGISVECTQVNVFPIFFVLYVTFIVNGQGGENISPPCPLTMNVTYNTKKMGKLIMSMRTQKIRTLIKILVPWCVKQMTFITHTG